MRRLPPARVARYGVEHLPARGYAATLTAQRWKADAVSRITGAVLAGVLGAATLVAPAGSGLAATAPTAAATTARSRPMTHPFAREAVHFGERDRSPYDIEHVRELQLRLQREHLFRFTPTG